MNLFKSDISLYVRRSLVFCAALALLTLSYGLSANALIPAPPQVAATSYLLIDAHSGKAIIEYEADKPLPPASLTKMMTTYIAEHELTNGNISFEDKVRVSVKAWKTKGSRMFIKEGDFVSIDDLIRGVVIQSGNDASVALAEYLGGSEEAFADLMNQHAQRLGMKNTQYKNATGLPAEGHFTTARDLAILAQAIIFDYPQHYDIYAEKYFTYNNIRQPNRNRLLWRDPSVDGLKTGHTEEAGYCLVSSAERNGMRLIAVVMGTSGEEARAAESQKLLTYGFRYFETQQLYSAAEELNESKLWGGQKDNLSLGIADELFLTFPRGQKDKLNAEVEVQTPITAPVSVGQVLGRILIKLGNETIAEKDLVALEAVEQAGLVKRLWHKILLFFHELING